MELGNQRPFEFRARNLTRKSWVYSTHIPEETFPQEWFIKMLHDGDKYELNQYTGIKDKYGVKIYENDILAETDWQGKNIVWFVVWDLAKFCLKRKPWYKSDEGSLGRRRFRSEPNTLRVIGNIYDNQELVTK